MTTPTDFNTRFKELCEAFELTTQPEWDAVSIECALEESEWMKGDNNANDAKFMVEAHRLFPAIKAEMERLKKDQCPHWEEPSGTLIEMWDAFAHSLSSLTSDKANAEIKEVWGYFWQLDRIVRNHSPTLESQASELTEARARIEEQEKHIADLNHDMEEMHKAMNEGYGIAFESGYDCAENQ